LANTVKKLIFSTARLHSINTFDKKLCQQQPNKTTHHRIIDEYLQNTMHMPTGSHNPDSGGIWSTRNLIKAL
jgi:hypothetical protein